MRKSLNLSPNFSKKTRTKLDIKFVIIHYTGIQSEIESIKRLKNPKSKVSCHYLINKKGKIEDTFASFTKPMSDKLIKKIQDTL